MLIFHSSFFFSNIENVLRISSNLGEFDVLILDFDFEVNPLRANATKWSNTLKQFVGNLPTNCLSVFDHFVKLALKGLIILRTSYCSHHVTNEALVFASLQLYLKT